MRRSLTTNTLVIVSNHVKSIYDDRWDDDVLHYTGMGTKGDQSIDSAQNKTLAQSETNGVLIHLFEVFVDQEYFYRGIVALCNDPYFERQPDERGTARDVCVFPLRLKSDSAPIDREYLSKAFVKKSKKARRLTDDEVFERAKNANTRTGFRTTSSKQYNRNPLLYKNIGADGIKTGYLAVERYSLASSLERNGRRLIAVGSGFDTKNARSVESAKLLTYGLTNFDLVEINKSDKPFEKINVWLGKDQQVDVYVNEDIYKTIKKAKKRLLKVTLKYEEPIEAPIKKDDIIGKLRVVYDQELVGEYDLLASNNVKKVNIFTRLIKSLNYLIWGDV